VLFKRYSLELPFSAMASLTCPAATEDGTPKRDGGSERVRAAEECALSAYFPFVHNRPLSGCVTSTSSALRVLVTREGLPWHHTTATLTL